MWRIWRKRLSRSLKYALKGHAIAVSPRLYWWWRQQSHGVREPEISFVPWLASSAKIAVDVGANFGLWTWHLQEQYGHCHAFEPIPRLCEVLRQAFRHRPCRVSVHAVALSDRHDRVRLRIPRLAIGRSTIDPYNVLEGVSQGNSDILEIDVECRPLDSYLLQDVGFMKIDVEGHELEVLRGACDTIARCLPSLLVETEERHRPGTVAAVWEYLRAFDYRRVVWSDGQLTPMKEGDATPPRNFFFLQPSVADAVAARVRHQERST